MIVLKILFWVSLFVVFYAYIGYGIVLFLLIKVKRLFKGGYEPPIINQDADLPEVTFVVAAYNEADYMVEKIENCLDFDYPKDKINYLFVTDGSDDDTPDVVRNYQAPPGVEIRLYHEDARQGKIAAVERIMAFVDTPIVIYTDANTFVNKMAIRHIVRHYEDPKVGAVAGEKRIRLSEKDAANSAGEGIYWKYESTLKKWDSELKSVVGAAGEVLSFQYISHRVLRWTLAPLALIVILITNIILANGGSPIYQVILAGQLLFYAMALLGYILETKKIKLKAFFVPYYFCIMNYAVFRGFFRYLGDNQSVMWERSKRADSKVGV